MRPTTGRERSRRYQREANDLLEAQLYAIQDLAQPQTPSDTRPRGTCPACLEMMLRGASTCPHCHTTGITWSTETEQESVETHKEQPVNTKRQQPNKAKEIYKAKDVENACYKCGGIAVLGSSGNVVCMGKGCGKLEKGKYPQYFQKAKDVENACYKCGGIAILEGSNVVCSWTCGKLRKKKYPHLFSK